MHYYYPPFHTDAFSPFYFLGPFTLVLIPLLIIAVLAVVVLKGFALWHAAKHNQRWWFIALLIINTLGILEIVYLVWFRPSSPYFIDKKKHHNHHAAHAHSSSHAE